MSRSVPWKDIWLFMPEGEVTHRPWVMTQLAGLAHHVKWVEVRSSKPKGTSSVLPLGIDHQIWPARWGGIHPKNPGIEDGPDTLFLWVGDGPQTAQRRWLSQWKKVWKAALLSQAAQDPLDFHFWLKTDHTPVSAPAWPQLVGVLAQVRGVAIPGPNAAPNERQNSESEP